MAVRVAYGSSGVNAKSSDDDEYGKENIPSHHQGIPAVGSVYSDGDSDTKPLLGTHSYILVFKAYEVEAEKLYKGAGIGDLDEEKQRGFFDSVKTCYQNFFDGLSALGKDEKNPDSTSIVAGMATAIAGASLFTMLVPILNTVCSKFASVFNSSTDEVARTIFSGLCIVSTGIRAAIPIAVEGARFSNNLRELLIFSIATVVMASVYLATSFVSMLLAGHSAILDSPTTGEMVQKLKTEIDEVKAEIEGLKTEIEEIAKTVGSKNCSQVASEGLQEITKMLAKWKAQISVNWLSFGKEFLLFSGAVLSAFSAISKFVPNIAIPFVSIITGAISLVANVFEVAQGLVEYRSQKAELESLREELKQETDPSKKKEMAEQISKLENQLKVSVVRIVKGMLNVVLSIASIVLGILVTVSVFTQPVFLLAGSILTAVSLASVLVLGVSGLVVRKMNNV